MADELIIEEAKKSASTKTNKKVWSIVWTTKKRIVAASIGIFLILIATGLTWYTLAARPSSHQISYKPSPTPTPSPTPAPKDSPDPLNGELYTEDEAAAFANLRPIGVMVENHVLARPQSGLQDAEVIYEAMAEGGITRFMAVYLAKQPDKIGPVRSARLHYISWAAEYNAVYAHWGGSAEALGFLSSHAQPVNLDEFQHAKTFYRDSSGGKPIEHTGYTSGPLLRQTTSQMGVEKAISFTSWAFKADALPADRPISQILKVSFLGTSGYAAEFDYRPESNDYARLTGGQPHKDADGEQLVAKSIVLLYQKVTPYTDTNGHAAVTVQTIGSGKAVVIEDGAATEGTWAKASMNDRTLLTDSAGQSLQLNRGKVWVISVPIGSSVTY